MKNFLDTWIFPVLIFILCGVATVLSVYIHLDYLVIRTLLILTFLAGLGLIASSMKYAFRKKWKEAGLSAISMIILFPAFFYAYFFMAFLSI